MAGNEPRYDAFVSYSHGQDAPLARALQSELERFARPWYRPRAVRVFRDATNLSASPGLWQSIEQALEGSSWFILIASPASAASEWVRKEVQWWLAHRDAGRILLALTSGEIRWAGTDFDWARTDALPPELSGAFGAEPFWIDLRKLRPGTSPVTGPVPRLGDMVAEFAAPIHGRDKDALVGEHVRYQRRTRRLVRTVIGTLSVLLVAVSVAAYVANDQRDKAVTQARIATARQLAAESGALLTTNLDIAQLLAVKAYRTDQDPQTLTALFEAVTASPALVRYMPAGDQVSAITGSADGRVAVAGTSGGDVLRWDLAAGTRTRVTLLHQPVSAVASNKDGTVIAATSRSKVAIWAPGRRTEVLRVPSSVNAGQIAVSPTGRFVAIAFFPVPATANATQANAVAVVDRQTGQFHRISLDAVAAFLAMSTEATLIVVKALGVWERFSVPGLSPTLVSTRATEGAHPVIPPAISANGAFFAYGDGGSTIGSWSTARPPSALGVPDLVGLSHGSNPEALAISADGKHVAVADAGTIYVGETGRTAPGSAAQLVLSGNSSTSAIVFVGDGSRLLSTSGDSLILWDLSQPTRIGTHSSMSMPGECAPCGPPAVAVRPDGRQAAVIGEISGAAPPRGAQVTVYGLGPSPGQTVITGDQYGVLGWNPDGSRLFLARSDGSVEIRAAGRGTSAPVIGRWPPFARGQTPIALSRDGRRVITLGTSGQIQVYDPVTRRLERTIPGPAVKNGNFEATASATGAFVGETIFRSDGTTFLRLIDTRTGTVRTVGKGDVGNATFSGPHLLVLRNSGQLEAWNLAGTVLQRSLHEDHSYVLGASGALTAPVVAGSFLIQQRSDGTLTITDLGTGDRLGSLTLPAGYAGVKTGFAATPDGRQLIGVTEATAALNGSGLLVRWNLSPGAWIRTACASAGRNLTAAEWRQYPGTTPGNLACLG
jgi:WD40 repeat protein